ncbi:hypothetical protein D9M71_39030 [compost metagenome]
MSTKEVKRMWECGSCGELHDFKSSAESCCIPDVEEVWVCPCCDEAHGTEQQAIKCCEVLSDEGESSITCPSCLRDHPGDVLAQSAIAISGHCSHCNPLFTIDQQLAIEDLHFQVTGKVERLNA